MPGTGRGSFHWEGAAAGRCRRWGWAAEGGSERCLKSPLVLFTAQMASEAITVAMNAALFFTLKGKIPVPRARGLKDSGSVDFAPNGNELFSK